MEFLTPEDKKTLRVTSRYLKSVDLRDGIIDFYLEGSNINQYVPFNQNSIYSFSNAYNIPIPEFLGPLIDKILTQFEDNIDNIDVDYDYLNYSRFEINIDTETMSITGTKYWSYNDKGDTDGTSWDAENDPDDISYIFGILDQVETDQEELRVDYNGSGDSGFLNSDFDSGENVPKEIEDWCYSTLESQHGGWEINEGSDGYFIFDLKNKTISLEHTYNEEVHKEDTVFEESFDK